METTKPVMQNAVILEEKYKSTVGYTKGTILHAEDTGLNYLVTNCVRIDISSVSPQYGITVQEIVPRYVIDDNDHYDDGAW